MSRPATVIRPEIPAGRRVIAVSDIHGNLACLKGLLKKAGFCRDDVLVLVGDLLEKGRDSLATLRYVMELAEGGNVYAVKGNCDGLADSFVDRPGGEEIFASMLRQWGERWLLSQMARSAGVPLESAADFSAVRETVAAVFRRELDFLRGLPNIIDTPNFLFVHGGVPSAEHLEELDAWGCMKNDDFMNQETHLSKWCVVGHWPVTLYAPDIPSARPIIDRAKHIISIDGGCVLKADGQLNALVIPDGESEDFSYVSYDGFPTVTALDAQEAGRDSINIRWSENVVTVLERGEEFCRCRHGRSGRVIDILSDYLWERDGVTHCEDSTDYRLGVLPGDTLSVVRRTSRGLLAKKDGVTGWYTGRVSEEKKDGAGQGEELDKSVFH